MPCFEKLFPPIYDSKVQDMLWEMAMFHALSYLRLHTAITLRMFDAAVITMAKAIRTFRTQVCAKVNMWELLKETASCKRRKQATKKNAVIDLSAKKRELNLNTYKYHRLGDYPRAVREFGPLDGYSTQAVSPYVIATCTQTPNEISGRV